MNIRQLETFHWIAQLGTFSAAAERLHTSQANVSARIRELEDQLGVALFDRIGRQVNLTVKGRELLAHARDVLKAAAQLRLAAGKPEMVQGVIKIGLGEVIATQSLLGIIDEVKQRFPDAEIEFDIDVNTHLVRKLVRGSVDVAVLGGPVDAPELQLMPIGDVALSWVASPALCAGRSTIAPGDLSQQSIMSLPRDARLHALMQDWFAEGGAMPKRISYCNSLSTMLEAARAGMAWCMVPSAFARQDLESGQLLGPEVHPALPALKFYVATRHASVDPAIPTVAAIVASAARPSMSAALTKG